MQAVPRLSDGRSHIAAGDTEDSREEFPRRSTASCRCVDNLCDAQSLINLVLFLTALHSKAGGELAGDLGGVRVDFVLSLLALQHMVPQLQIAALEHLCDALAPSGIGFIQLLTGTNKQRSQPKLN